MDYNVIAVQQIGRYQVLKELGRGAMGIVYQALDPAIGRTVAVKSIRLSELSEPGEHERLRERLLREARAAGMLSHPGIVTIYDISEEHGTAYVFMEFVAGQPLEERMLSEEGLEAGQVLDILRQTADALDYAHQQLIVHRDIKPANVMISSSGAVKITDFGVAKLASQQKTQAGAMMGTPNYMSPEQIQGGEVDGRSDQFSLAVIAYELLTGEKPFTADNLPSLLFKIVKEEPAAATRLNPTLHAGTGRVLTKAFAKDPEQRYATCSEFVSALASSLEESPGWRPQKRGSLETMATVAGPCPQLEPSASPPPPRRRREEEPSHLVRNVVLVFFAVVAIGLGLMAGRRYWEPLLQPEEVLPIPEAQVEAPPAELPEPPAKEVAVPPPKAKPAEPKPAPVEEPPKPPEAEPEPVREEPSPARPPEPAKLEPPTESLIWFRTEPPGANITLDDNPELTCLSPCSLTLPVGRHVVRAKMEGYRAGLRIFQSAEDSAINLKLERLTGTLALRTNPPDASITLNGKTRTERTPALLTLPVGTYRLELFLQGYSRYEETIQVKDQVISNIDVNWRP